MADYSILLGQVDNLDIDLSEARYILGKGIEDVKQFGESIVDVNKVANIATMTDIDLTTGTVKYGDKETTVNVTMPEQVTHIDLESTSGTLTQEQYDNVVNEHSDIWVNNRVYRWQGYFNDNAGTDILYVSLQSDSRNDKIYVLSINQDKTYGAKDTKYIEDVLYGSNGSMLIGSNHAPKKLPIGIDGQVLTAKDGVPVWQDTVDLDGDNIFTGSNTFAGETTFSNGLDTNGNVSVTNAVLKVFDSTDSKDLVTQYAADEIVRETGTNSDKQTYHYTLPDKSGTLATSVDLEGKINVAEQTLVNRVYARTEAGTDTTLPYTYTAEGSSIAYRNSSGQMQTETPSQDNDAANKKYVDDKAQHYLSLSGESGTLDESQYALVTTYDNLIIQRSGVDLRRCGYPSNGQGNYIFITPYNASANGSEEFDAYIITIKQDKTWEFKLKNFIQVSEQTYAPVVTITPDNATNGTLDQDDFDNLSEHHDVQIKLNNEYYICMDDGNTEGLMSYIHEGWNGKANQTKSINITKATRAWTLVIGSNECYEHHIQLTADSKTFYYSFVSSKKDAYTSTTLPVMPDNVITPIHVVASGYYSSISGLVYRNGEGDLKLIVHGMYTNNGTSMSYLALTGADATFVSDTVVVL